MTFEASLLYHYTTATGLKGIVDDGAIRASDAEFLNDAMELRFGRDELHEALIAEAERIAPEADPNRGGGADYSRAVVMRSAASHLRPDGIFLSKQAHAVYAACFCEGGDLLSQWRGYAADGGYAIGFNSVALRDIGPIPTTLAVISEEGRILDHLEGPPLEVRLVQVRYGPDAIAPAVRRVVETVAPNPVGHPGSKGWMQAQRVVLPELATIKHAAFEEEHEWRLLGVGSQGFESVQFRIGALGLIPYIPLSLPTNSIAEIVIGPGPHPDVREHGVIRFLAMNGLGDVSVRHSSAPYRG